MACWSKIEGTWSYWDLIGAKFKLKSVPLSINGVLQKDLIALSRQDLILEEIFFRASTDGKLVPLFRMKNICGKLFRARDLELIEINPLQNISTYCGNFICGRVLVGNKLDANNPFNSETPEIDENPENSEKREYDYQPLIPRDNENQVNNTTNIDDWEIISL